MDGKYETIGTKVTPETAMLLRRAAGNLGVSLYQMLQLVLVCFIRCADTETPSHAPDPAMLAAADVFERITERNRANAGRDTGRDTRQASAAVYLVERDGGTVAVLIEKGRKLATYNPDAIVMRVLAATLPKTARDIRTLKRRMEARTATETIRTLVRLALGDAANDTADIAALFADNERTDAGRDTRLVKYKRHNNQADPELGQAVMDFG